MRFSVDINLLRNHISILHKEQQEAVSLISHLTAWRNQATQLDPCAIDLVDSLLVAVRKQGACIRRRIALLEDMEEKFHSVKQSTAELLVDATRTAESSFDTVLF